MVQVWSMIIDAVEGVIVGVLVGVLASIVAVGVASWFSFRLSFVQAAEETMLSIKIIKTIVHRMFLIRHTFNMAMPSV